MSACSGSNNLDCGCTSSSLSTLDVALPGVGNDFRFLSFDGVNNIVVDQTPNGIVISQVTQPVGVHIGLNQINTSGLFTQNPLIFNDTTVTGFFNSGLYSAGVITAPVTDIYTLHCQLVIGSTTFAVPEFARLISIIVNGTPVAAGGKTSFSNEIMTASISMQLNLTAGDTVQISATAGGIGVPPYSIRNQSFLSFKKV